MVSDDLITVFRNHGREDFLQVNGSSFVKRCEGVARKGFIIDDVDTLCILHKAYFHAYFELWFGSGLDLDSKTNPKSVFELVRARIEGGGCCVLSLPTKELDTHIRCVTSALKAYFLHDIAFKSVTTTLTERRTGFRVVGIYDRDPKGSWGLNKGFL